MRRFVVFFLIFLFPLQLLDQSYFDSSPQPTTYVASLGVLDQASHEAAGDPSADVQSTTSSGSLEPDLSDSVDLRMPPVPGRFATAPPSVVPKTVFPSVVYSVLEPPRG